MADIPTRPAIPAWQRTAQASITDVNTTSHVEDKVDSADPAATPHGPPASSKAPMTTDELETQVEAIGPSDIEAFKKEQQKPQKQHPSQSQTPPRPVGPPIITYPEFLVEARKPPPLITPSRVVNAAYFAVAVAALIYGANKFLVTPMADNLTEARHDFASHSQSKLDDFNARLAGLVNQQVPDAKNAQLRDAEFDDTSSELSDPTELFHRDMGTQTSPLPSRRPSDPAPDPSSNGPSAGHDAVTRHSAILGNLKEHFDGLAEGMTKQEQDNMERQESLNKLRHYLDKLTYSSASGSGWVQGDDGLGLRPVNGGVDDAIEDFKKDIRSVKGVLLSARRFPLPRARD